MSKTDSETKKNYSNAHPSKIIDDDNIKLANKVIFQSVSFLGPSFAGNINIPCTAFIFISN